MRLTVDEVLARTTALFVRLGLSAEHAGQFAEILLEAELEGNGGHGLGRIPIYANQLLQKGLNPAPQLWFERPRPAVAVLHADRSPGPIAALLAVDEAAHLARSQGMGSVAVRNAGHVGVLSAYVGRLAQQGLVGMAFANTPPAIAPGPVLGTNPIALGVPRRPHPLIVDTSISVVARGKILAAARKKEPLQPGWALDAQGQPTTDPQQALQGSLVPVGGGKGFALAVLVEVLAGVMGGAMLSQDIPLPWLSPEKPGTPGFLLMAHDPAAYGSGFAERLERMVGALVEAGGRIPGDRRAQLRAQAMAQGLEVTPALLDELSGLGLEF